MRRTTRIVTRRTGPVFAAAVLAVAALGCGSPGDHEETQAATTGMTPATTALNADDPDVARHTEMFDGVDTAVAVLSPTEGHDVRGTVTFTETDAGVKIVATVEGLEPGSTHGFHIHQYGDVTADDGTAAGGHYDPEHHDHALPDERPRHAGDLGNLKADDQGVAHLDLTVENITVAGLDNPVIGRAVIVHSGADDGSQPTGGAGARLAQGVIGVAENKDSSGS